MQKLEEADSAARVRFCNWFSEAVCNGVINPMLTYCAHDGWLYFNGHVNTQNSRYWSADDSILIYDVPLHDVKFGV